MAKWKAGPVVPLLLAALVVALLIAGRSDESAPEQASGPTDDGIQRIHDDRRLESVDDPDRVAHIRAYVNDGSIRSGESEPSFVLTGEAVRELLSAFEGARLVTGPVPAIGSSCEFEVVRNDESRYEVEYWDGSTLGMIRHGDAMYKLDDEALRAVERLRIAAQEA